MILPECGCWNRVPVVYEDGLYGAYGLANNRGFEKTRVRSLHQAWMGRRRRRFATSRSGKFTTPKTFCKVVHFRKILMHIVSITTFAVFWRFIGYDVMNIIVGCQSTCQLESSPLKSGVIDDLEPDLVAVWWAIMLCYASRGASTGPPT